MSDLDLRLEWAENQTRERLEGDHYQGECDALEEAQIEQQEGLAPPEEILWPEEFEWSHERAQRWQSALGAIEGLTATRLQGHLRALLAACRAREPVDDLLNLTEAWLADRLADWKVVTEVRPREESEAEQAEEFNRSLEAGADGLSLAQEIVGLLRAGELDLVERLIEQVGEYLLEARNALLAAEPAPPEDR